MAFGTNTGQDITFNVGAVALTQFTFVKMGAAGVVVCTGADGEEPVGVGREGLADQIRRGGVGSQVGPRLYGGDQGPDKIAEQDIIVIVVPEADAVVGGGDHPAAVYL